MFQISCKVLGYSFFSILVFCVQIVVSVRLEFPFKNKNEEYVDGFTGALIQCVAEDLPLGGNVAWFYPNGTKLSRNHSSIRPYEDRRSDADTALYLNNLSPDQAGDYTCKAFVDDKEVAASSFKIIHYEKIKFKRCDGKQYPTRGLEQQLLNCTMTGVPPPSVTWSFNGKQVTASSEKFGTPTLEGLPLLNIGKEHEGQYSLQATQLNKIYRKIIKVETYTVPVIHNFQKEYIVLKNSSLTLYCNATGYPKPQITWFRNIVFKSPVFEDMLPLFHNNAENVLLYDDGSIYFRKVDEFTERDWVCQAKNNNTLGLEARERTVVDIQDPPHDPRGSNKEVNEGKAVSLVCSFAGDPPPNITVFKNGEEIINGQVLSGSSVAISKSTKEDRTFLELAFKSASRGHAGRYSCVAENRVGKLEHHLQLDVVFGPELVGGTTRDEYVWVGAVQNVSCAAKGFPGPSSFLWLYDGRPVTEDANHFLFSISRTGDVYDAPLQISTTDSASYNDFLKKQYSCLVKNKLSSEASLVVSFKAAAAPGLPQVSARSGPTWLELDVRLPDYRGLPLLYYTVVYDNPPKTLNKTADHNFVHIPQLRPETDYSLRVSVSNVVGRSGEATLTASTTAATEPEAPVLRDTAVDSRQVVLAWEVQDNGAPITQMKVQYRTVDANNKPLSEWTQWTTVKNPGSRYTLKGLDPDTGYEVAMRVQNNIGYSDQTKKFYRTILAKDYVKDASSTSSPNVSLCFVFVTVLLLAH